MTDELVILVPGTEGPARESFAGLYPLLERDYDVHLFDFYSDRDYSPEENFRDYLRQLRTILDKNAARPVHLLGYSLGAHIALNLAAATTQVKSLCLIGGWLKTDAFQRERHDLWLHLYEKQPALAGRLSHLLQYSPTYRALLTEQQTAGGLLSSIPSEEVWHRVHVNRILDSTEAAQQVEIPTLLISGTSDIKVPTVRTLELYAALENATLIQAKSGHGVLRERLGQVYGAYDDFLKGSMKPGLSINALVP